MENEMQIGVKPELLNLLSVRGQYMRVSQIERNAVARLLHALTDNGGRPGCS